MTTAESSAGLITDFISGTQIKATPEEVEAVQVFARRLVEDYGYPATHIQTRPQFRVRMRPSDEGKTYPVDIAVFTGDVKGEANLFMIVECKKRNRQDGLAQLKLYMAMSPAEIGVWFNGQDHIYLRKLSHKDGRQAFEELPAIPRFGQRIEDIGFFHRRDLKKPSNLKAVFKDIRNHLAGNVTGITRDEALAQEIVNLLFCKIYDELNTGQHEIVTFRTGHGEHRHDVHQRIIRLFQDQVKKEYNDVFSERDTITLDAENLTYVVGELQGYCITEAERDAIGDAFEVFIGPALRGSEGQFFTPRNVVKMIVEIIDPEPGDLLLDPASGSGGFLITALEHVWRKLENQASEKGWNAALLERKKRDTATRYFRGIEKDSFLAKVTKAYMAVIADGRGGIFCENSLLPPDEWHYAMRDQVKLGTFDVIMTNPPFGAKIPIKGEALLAQYALGHKWRKDAKSGLVEQTTDLHDDQSPQLLFLERCLQLLKPGGRMGIVLPESMLGNPSYGAVINWLLTQATIKAIVTLPEPLFKTSGKSGTHTKVCALFLEKGAAQAEQEVNIFMADAKWCGHDSRGNPTLRQDAEGKLQLLDDVPVIAERYHQLVLQHEPIPQDHLGFLLPLSQIRNHILVPKYYNPELQSYLQALGQTHQLLRMGDLVEQKLVNITTGVEVGKMAYGTGPIPFIRTSDISNWELKIDPKQGVSEEIYEALQAKLDVRAGDILVVRDGTYLIGTSAIVTESDTRILFQSHIYKIRVLNPAMIDPWLLFAGLNSPVVKRQIRAKQFTQDIIDTLGNRILEILIPIPLDPQKQSEIAATTRKIVEERVALRNQARQVVLAIEGIEHPPTDDPEILNL